MKIRNIYIVGLLIFSFFSCKEERTKKLVVDENNAVKVNITHSAGDKWLASDSFLALPFNVANGGGEEILVLSERLKKGEKIDVKPIGAVRVEKNDSLLTYVIGLPSDKKLQTIPAADFDEFSTVYSGAKWIIEQYLVNRQDADLVKLKSWENENYAIKYLLK